ncbi:serine hydrolase, partial [Kocuria sp. CPCC 205281]
MSSPTRHTLVAALAAALLLGTSGGSGGVPSSATAAADTPAPSALEACVADVDDVVTREPSSQMNEALPEDQAARLDAAARASFEQVP